MQTISWEDFVKVELRVGRIVHAAAFSEARKPAYVLHVDFGEEIGVKKSSAQITHLYKPEELIGKLVVAPYASQRRTCLLARSCYSVAANTALAGQPMEFARG